MDTEKIKQSLIPVSKSLPPNYEALQLAAETPLQKQFDNRKGPSVNGSEQIDYHVFCPAKADGDKTRYPVVIWLHGMSQGKCFREPLRRTDIANFTAPEYQAKFGDGAYIMVPRANEDLGECATYGFWYTNTWFGDYENVQVSSQLPQLTAAIRQFLREEEANIDPARVYLVGFSAGGYMTWQTLLAMPDVFAAAVPICQALFVPTDQQLRTVAHVPMWVICGEKDGLFEKYVVPTIDKLRLTHAADLRVTILDKVLNPDYSPAESEHHSWVPVTFDMLYNDGKPYDKKYPDGFIHWLMSHRRQK